MTPRFFLRTLGQPVLFGPDGEPIRFRVRKHLALLVYLAVSPRSPQRRDYLANLLWPSAPIRGGRHSLATALSMLRAKLGRSAFDTSRDTVRFAMETLDIDLERLETGHVLGDQVTPPLEVDAFLESFELQDGEGFLRWRDRQQARLLPRIVAALERLIDLSRRTANSKELERLGDRLMALDALSEQGIRAKMEGRAFAGDRLTALRLFEEWKEQLGQELGAMPSELVEGIAIRLRRRGWERTTPTDVPSVSTDQWRNRPFIGRCSEYQLIYEAWEHSRDMQPRHALICGDSGIGKTTIVERLTTAAGLEGASPARVQCYELDREIPYAAISALVNGLLGRAGAGATPPEALSELSRVAPGVRTRFPSVPEPPAPQGESARIRLTEAFFQLLSSVAEEHPAVLVVDDIHLADDASLAVLHQVVRRIDTQPIMIVLTMRVGELGATPTAARILETAPALGIGVVNLRPLSPDESGALIDSFIQDAKVQLTGGARRAILRAGAGTPMVMELLLRDWQAHGEESIALSMDAMTTELRPASRSERISAYERLLDRISQLLDPTSRSVLNLATLLGHRLNDVSMYELIDLRAGEVMAGLARLTELRVLRDSGDGLEFTNELLRTCAYQAVPSTIRRLLHSKIADRLLAQKTEHSQGLELAWHCVRGGRGPEACRYLLAGAAEALRSGAPHEAERALITGLSLLKGKDRSYGVILLVGCLQEQAEWTRSLAALDENQQYLVPEDRAYARVLQIIARAETEPAPPNVLFSTMEELCHILRTEANIPTRAIAARAAGRINSSIRDAPSAKRVYDTLAEVPRECFGIDDNIEVEVALALLAFQSGDSQTSHKHLDRALELTGRTGLSNSCSIRVYVGLGTHAAMRGQYHESIILMEQVVASARRAGNASLVRDAYSNLAVCHSRLGNVRQQIESADRSIALRSPTSSDYCEAQTHYAKSLGHAWLGERPAAMAAITAFEVRAATQNVPEWISRLWMLMKADVLLLLGLERQARDIARGALSYDGHCNIPRHFEGQFARWLVMGALNEHELRSILPLLERLRNKANDLDALDRAEAVAAWIGARQRLGISRPADFESYRSYMAALPSHCARLLDRMGLLQDGQTGSAG